MRTFILMFVICRDRHVYGKVKDFKSVPFAMKVFIFAHKMQLSSLENDVAIFIGGHEIKADVIFNIYNVFVQKGNTAGFNLVSKSKVNMLKRQCIHSYKQYKFL